MLLTHRQDGRSWGGAPSESEDVIRISATEEYGLRCLVTLARRGEGRQVSITEIAQEEGLSLPYASKLLTLLRESGLVTAARGRSGGFALAKDPRELSLLEILTALGGPLLAQDHCSRFAGALDVCAHKGACSIRNTLDVLAETLGGTLSKTSLHDLAEKT